MLLVLTVINLIGYAFPYSLKSVAVWSSLDPPDWSLQVFSFLCHAWFSVAAPVEKPLSLEPSGRCCLLPVPFYTKFSTCRILQLLTLFLCL